MNYKQIGSTKKAREKALAELKILAAENEASLEVDDLLSDGKHIHLTIAKGAYRVGITLDNIRGLDAFLGHWYTDYKAVATYPKDFGYTVGGSINNYHWRKATTVQYTWDAFKEKIAAGLKVLPPKVLGTS